MLLTDNKILINSAKKNYNRFKVPTSFVDSKKTERLYNSKHKRDLDVKTSVNKIGEIVNLSQYLNSIMWEKIHKHANEEEIIGLYYDICKLAVMSGIEIDRAKKEYTVDTTKELKLLKDKYKIINSHNKIIKPMFFKNITLENGYELSNSVEYKTFNTPMDYLQKHINSFKFRQGRDFKSDVVPFSDLLKQIDLNGGGQYYEKRDRILDLIYDLKSQINNLYINYDSKTKDDKEHIKIQANDLKQECIEYINNIAINDVSMYLLLKSIESKEYRKISRLVFTTLFGTPNKHFFKLIKENSGELKNIVENQYGNIKIFDFNYIKV